jgi:hypothetical protein
VHEADAIGKLECRVAEPLWLLSCKRSVHLAHESFVYATALSRFDDRTVIGALAQSTLRDAIAVTPYIRESSERRRR